MLMIWLINFIRLIDVSYLPLSSLHNSYFCFVGKYSTFSFGPFQRILLLPGFFPVHYLIYQSQQQSQLNNSGNKTPTVKFCVIAGIHQSNAVDFK